MAKAIVPKMVGEVIDRAMQVHGAEGICRAFRSSQVLGIGLTRCDDRGYPACGALGWNPYPPFRRRTRDRKSVV